MKPLHALAMPTLGAALMCLPLLAGAQETDPDTGLLKAEGWETVRNNCTACHSAKLVTQNSGSRNHWQYLIRWMQDTQGLWEFEDETEEAILDYLAEYYGPKEDTRRPALPRTLMPDNPYPTVTDPG
ncbi:hypothetical protein [Halomonas korlensis]|uniref:Sulfite dehydrogenase (Cytochrome) subunit SorB n=1 Tax=Halomonas korlensis TaxID=463301 RepID=A0A1I7JN87_9GAMM|nr:hypothetical protein [Halomonas korlensis]SFU86618.1 hypothetical protein SAMN04487955_11198 [Halomonas korlensis]